MTGVHGRDWRPRYLQLAEELRAKIMSGELAPGTLMPSETELAESSGLSRTSVRNAIRQLREWGLVRAEQGRGTYVRAPASGYAAATPSGTSGRRTGSCSTKTNG